VRGAYDDRDGPAIHVILSAHTARCATSHDARRAIGMIPSPSAARSSGDRPSCTDRIGGDASNAAASVASSAGVAASAIATVGRRINRVASCADHRLHGSSSRADTAWDVAANDHVVGDPTRPGSMHVATLRRDRGRASQIARAARVLACTRFDVVVAADLDWGIARPVACMAQSCAAPHTSSASLSGPRASRTQSSWPQDVGVGRGRWRPLPRA